MLKDSDLGFLNSRVSALLENHVRNLQGGIVPVDLEKVALAAGVSRIDRVMMIPEGALVHGESGFVVYLQANFQHSPGAHLKQRFVLAHEICHALLYERIDANKIRRRRMGEAERESLCNRGAGWLVLPEFVVDWFVQRNGRIRTTEQILALATDAQVSLETVIRRLHENPSKWLEVDHGFVLAQAHAEVPTIRAVAYGPWMWGKIPVPQLYQAEKDWISKLRFDHDLVEGSETTIHLNPGILRLEKAHPRSSSYVYKIRHEAG